MPSGSGDSANFSCALTATQLAAGNYSSVAAVFSPAVTSSSIDDQLCDVDLDAAQELHGEPEDEVDHDLAVCGDLAHHRCAETAEALSGTVTGQSGDGYPQGTVTVKSGTTTLRSEALPVGSGDSAAFSCSLTASQLGAGTYSSIDAIFTPATTSSSSADFSYTGSASARCRASR